MINYYDVLGISSDASQSEIKRAFKEKAMEHHPDRNQGDVEKEEYFKTINEAYQTLSNTYTRSNYDMLVRYGNRTPSRPFSTPPPFPPRAERPPVYRPKFDSKENLKATGYAFLFAFVLAAIIKAGVYFVEVYKEKEMTEILKERREVFQRVVRQKGSGNLEASLNLLDSMGRFYYQEQDMRDYRDQLLLDIRYEADGYLESGNYTEAIHTYTLLKDYSISTTIDYLLKIAKAHKGMGNYAKTLEIYQKLRFYGYETTSFYYELGLLYEEGARDYEQALNYYTISAQKAAAEYEVTIGKAYAVVISARMIPTKHYDIYMKVSEMKLKMGKYQEAIQSVAWSKEIWSDSLRLYEIEALSHRALGDSSQMNEVLIVAKSIDPNFTL